MLIRSKNGTELIEFENMHIGLDRQVKGGIIAFPYSANGKGILIGQYSTEETAIKVLDMIQQKCSYDDCRMMNITYDCDYLRYVEQQEYGVFQMPQESEV